MSKTLQQVTKDALTLPREDCERLIDRLVGAITTDSERAQVDATLNDRLNGSFTEITDPEAFYEEERQHFRKETARRLEQREQREHG